MLLQMHPHAPLDGPTDIVEEEQCKEEEWEEDEGQYSDPAFPPCAGTEGDAGEAVEHYPLVAVFAVAIVVVVVVVDGTAAPPDDGRASSEMMSDEAHGAARGATDAIQDRGVHRHRARAAAAPPTAAGGVGDGIASLATAVVVVVVVVVTATTTDEEGVRVRGIRRRRMMMGGVVDLLRLLHRRGVLSPQRVQQSRKVPN